MPEMSNEGSRATLQLLNEELSARLARQSDSGARIEAKATFIVGFASAAAQFLATRHSNVALAVLAYSFYALSFAAGVLAIAVARYDDTEPRPLLDHFASEPEPKVLAVLAATRVKMFERNAGKHRRKAVLWWVGVAALAIGLVLSVVGMGQT